MAAIYDYETADSITEGLQGCEVCDEAIRAAWSIARDRGESVLLEDTDGFWEVDPDESEARFLDHAEAASMGLDPQDHPAYQAGDDDSDGSDD